MATKTAGSIEVDPERYASGPVAKASVSIDCPECGATERMDCVEGPADRLRPCPTHAARAEAWWAREEAHR